MIPSLCEATATIIDTDNTDVDRIGDKDMDFINTNILDNNDDQLERQFCFVCLSLGVWPKKVGISFSFDAFYLVFVYSVI